MQEGSATRTSQASLSAALAAVHASAGPDGNHSLAEMAYRDLDATLQLLADRALYITGSTGAAIALRRIGKNDMLCRASCGVNAPELGALLSSEFGLSGESVRRRQTLRCDDAERDVRVNREVCRQMGIASVVVMPVVHDDEVLGVFELFSGRVNAFGERDLSALQRLSEMVETAVKLAHAAAASPDRFKHAEPAADAAMREIAEEPVLEVETEAETVATRLSGQSAVASADASAEILEEASAEPDVRTGAQPAMLSQTPVEARPEASSTVAGGMLSDVRTEVRNAIEAAVPEIIRAVVAGEIHAGAATGSAHEFPVEASPSTAPAVASKLVVRQPDETIASTPASAKKPVFWSAASVNPEVERPAEPDQSHVPMGLRNLRKCEACGFPVSASRVLCVECEEKKWRGQLTIPQKNAVRQSAIATASTPSTVAGLTAADLTQAELTQAERAAAPGSGAPLPGALSGTLSGTLSGLAAPARVSPPPTRTFAAAAQAAAPAMAPRSTTGMGMGAGTSAARALETAPAKMAAASLSEQVAASRSNAIPEPVATAAGRAPQVPAPSEPELVLSAGLAPGQSWFASNKYIVGALLVVAAVVAAVFLLR